MQIFLKKSFIIFADLFSIIISILLLRKFDTGLNFISIKQDLNFILITALLYCLFWFLLNENKNVYLYYVNIKCYGFIR